MGKHKTVQRFCIECGREFPASLSNIKSGWGYFCSKSCCTKFRFTGRIGADNYNWRGGVSTDNYGYKLRQVAKYPERCSARQKIGNLISRGQLKRGPCEVCGTAHSQAHHDDYANPLSVRWLCGEHHKELHRQLGTKNQ
jgi:hypothetical protein